MITFLGEPEFMKIAPDARRELAPLKWSRFGPRAGSRAAAHINGVKWYDVRDIGCGDFGLYIVAVDINNENENTYTFVERFATLADARSYADELRPFIAAAS